jgi:hypothetical protein
MFASDNWASRKRKERFPVAGGAPKRSFNIGSYKGGWSGCVVATSKQGQGSLPKALKPLWCYGGGIVPASQKSEFVNLLSLIRDLPPSKAREVRSAAQLKSCRVQHSQHHFMTAFPSKVDISAHGDSTGFMSIRPSDSKSLIDGSKSARQSLVACLPSESVRRT